MELGNLTVRVGFDVATARKQIAILVDGLQALDGELAEMQSINRETEIRVGGETAERVEDEGKADLPAEPRGMMGFLEDEERLDRLINRIADRVSASLRQGP